ncbi:MAG: porin [Saprospiraceae bacterium]|nr:porin [Saprospiraceae bacterium]
MQSSFYPKAFLLSLGFGLFALPSINSQDLQKEEGPSAQQLLTQEEVPESQTVKEELEAPFTITGSADVYFRSNLNGDNIIDDVNIAPQTSFANMPGFALGMFNAIGTYQSGKVGFTADLVFGPRGDEAVFGSTNDSGNPSNAAIINQLFIEWQVTDGIKFTLGNFNTFLGYEVISPAGNFNYSTSYMFSYGPFSHTGVKADFAFNDEISVMVGLFNPTDLTEFNPTGKYIPGAQVGYEKDSGGLWLNFLFDPDYTQVDLTTGWDLTDDLYMGLNSTIATDLFYGAAIYAQFALSEEFAIGLRGEYFKDNGIGIFANQSSVIDFTISGSYTVGNLKIIPEFRLDKLSDDEFIASEIPSGIQSSLSSFVLAAVYSF